MGLLEALVDDQHIVYVDKSIEDFNQQHIYIYINFSINNEFSSDWWKPKTSFPGRNISRDIALTVISSAFAVSGKSLVLIAKDISGRETIAQNSQQRQFMTVLQPNKLNLASSFK